MRGETNSNGVTVLDKKSADTPFKKTEKEIINKIMDMQPNLKISFVLNKIDYLDEEEIEETLEDVQRKLVKTFHKDMLLIPYSSTDLSMSNAENLKQVFQGSRYLNIEKERVNKTLPHLGWLLNKFNSYLHQKEKDLNNLVLAKKSEMEGVKNLRERFIMHKNKFNLDLCQ